jgi:tetrahydromethanopterin S-methyltransferase subunit G
MQRETWTDERLDDLSRRMDQRFDQVDQRFGRVEGDLRELRGEIGEIRSLIHRFGTGIIATIVVAALLHGI